MSRQHDMMFCKIAVANGMVSEEQAKKCLALVNKREQESGRRPQIGAIFSKYNILHRQEVQTIYEAVNRRIGGPPAGGVAAGPPGGAERARGGTRARGRRGRLPGAQEREPRKKKVDPQTLWMGIVFGIAFLGILLFLVVKFFVGPDKTPTVTDDGEVASSDKDSGSSTGGGGNSGTGASSTGGSSTGGSNEGGTGAGDAGAGAPPTNEIDSRQRGLIRQALADARDQEITDPARALAMVQNLRKEISKKKLVLPPEMEKEIKDLESSLKGSAGGGETGGGGDSIDEDI